MERNRLSLFVLKKFLRNIVRQLKIHVIDFSFPVMANQTRVNKTPGSLNKILKVTETSETPKFSSVFNLHPQQLRSEYCQRATVYYFVVQQRSLVVSVQKLGDLKPWNEKK